MKNIINVFLGGALMLLLINCGGNTTNSDDSQTEVQSENTHSKKPKSFIFSKEQAADLKEQLFFYLRKQAVGIDENTFVKFEELKITGSSYVYNTIIIDKELMTYNDIPKREVASFLGVGNFYQGVSPYELGDTIRINGDFKVNNDVFQSETPPSEASLSLSSHKYSSELYSSPYAYSGYERSIYELDFKSDLIVKFNEPIIYSKDEMYLVARFKKFTKDDLSGMSSDDLAYFRNEIFARHGHTFKTDKMKSYFESKNWYHAYFNDATSLLNETEKANVQLIRSMES